MPEQNLEYLLEEITAALVTADPRDVESTVGLHTLAHQLLQRVPIDETAFREKVAQFTSLAADLASGRALDPDLVLSELGRRLIQIRGEDIGPATAGTDDHCFILPEHVDDEIFAEFLANQKLVLEELEELILSLRGGRGQGLAELRRKLHTLKGEAGVLGLVDLEQVCHATETLLDEPGNLAARVETLLAVKDWISESLAHYRVGQMPVRSAESFMKSVAAVSARPARITAPVLVPVSEPPQRSSAGAPPISEASRDTLGADRWPLASRVSRAPPPAEAAAISEVPPSGVESLGATNTSEVGPVPVRALFQPSLPDLPDKTSCATGALANGWDDDQLGLIGEFIQESGDGLASVDQTLLDIEQNGFEPEKINRLFRVFHTIKGVSGFLEFRQITELAHTAETMLDAVRSGKLEPSTVVLDLVFDATTLMRELFAGVRDAAACGGAPVTNANVPALVVRLAQMTSGSARQSADAGEVLPEVRADERVGEILIRTASLNPEAVNRALEAAQATGRHIGEELIAQGLAAPKTVAHAIRAQNSARTAITRIREVVKVDLERVDRMVETIGELVIVESMVAHAPEVFSLPRHVRNYLSQLAKITRELQEIGMRMRMVPVRGEFQKMTRMIRDLSRKSGKEIRVEISGEATEMDRSMVERLADPLVHLIRNAVDHGVETPEARRLRGKSPTGTIRLSALHEGGSIVVEVRDDGNGIDRDAVLRKAIANGLVRPDTKLTEAEIFDLIFAPGFSTAKQITEVSGRGVGMDVVKRNVEGMRGRIQVISNVGAGTTFRMVLPLTLAIIDGMVIRSGVENFIIPTASIVESLKPTPDMLKTVGGVHELVVVRGESLPLLRLDQLLEIHGAETEPCRALIVIVETLAFRVGLVVDEVVTQQQVVIKNMGCDTSGTEVFSGAAILSDGRVGLIINVDELIAQGIRPERSRRTHSVSDPVPTQSTEAEGVHECPS